MLCSLQCSIRCGNLCYAHEYSSDVVLQWHCHGTTLMTNCFAKFGEGSGGPCQTLRHDTLDRDAARCDIHSSSTVQRFLIHYLHCLNHMRQHAAFFGEDCIPGAHVCRLHVKAVGLHHDLIVVRLSW